MVDYDGDGRLDLIAGSDDCCNFNGQFFLFRRGADGTFGARETLGTRYSKIQPPFFCPRTRVYFADWNLDKRLDLIVSFNEGRGVFLSFGPLADQGEIEMSAQIGDGEHTNSILCKPNVADWDGDGIPDLVVTIRMHDKRADSACLFRGISDKEGTRLSADPTLLVSPPDGARFTDLDVVDWDDDGTLDLLAGVTWTEGAGQNFKARSQVWVFRGIRADSRSQQVPGR
ncbi:MAG: VCBS repeat-containing protein [Planctomycetes bacterium]|nr:VCBS repeat-containing protein [Planctomycetota bacterium]